MRAIFARCMVRYTGRIDAELELGDRLIVRKDDGAVIIHATEGLMPRNWMPSGSEWSEEPGVIRVAFPKRGELLEIYLVERFSDQEHTGVLSGRLVKLGSEREFSDLLAERIEMIEPGLRLVGREFRTASGPIDLLALDADERPVAIEVKRARAQGVGVAYQLIRYLDALEADEAFTLAPRGILVAPGMGRPLARAISDRGLAFVRLRYEDLIAASTA